MTPAPTPTQPNPVGEFKQLALRAEQDGVLRQRLQHVLKVCC